MKNRIEWDDDARERMKKAPFFIRKKAMAKVEKAALALGEKRISLELLEQIKKQEMGR